MRTISISQYRVMTGTPDGPKNRVPFPYLAIHAIFGSYHQVLYIVYTYIYGPA